MLAGDAAATGAAPGSTGHNQLVSAPRERSASPVVQLPLEHNGRAPAHARRGAREVLLAWRLPALVDSVVLVVSELVTNAVLHARTGLSIEVERHDGVVRVTVRDGSPQQPRRRRHGVSAGTGRGLGLLATLATAWGSETTGPPHRKAVWFELPVDPAALPDPGDGALL